MADIPLTPDQQEALRKAQGESGRSDLDTRTAMAKPLYVNDYLEGLAGPNEQHEADPEGHCENPKCRARMSDQAIAEADRYGEWHCEGCGMVNSVMEDAFTPGGKTRAGITLDQMGQIGESVVERMGELPGIGVVTDTFPSNSQKGTNPAGEPVDAIVVSSDGTRYGCEIKCNHSQAQERFKIGDKAERLSKIKYCQENGLTPALVGVRLNFYTDKAFVFFRPGLTDTWMGNKKMQHIATVDFADLNPFASPDPEMKQQAIDNANLPDQAVDNPDADLDALFGPAPSSPQAFSREIKVADKVIDTTSFKGMSHVMLNQHPEDTLLMRWQRVGSDDEPARTEDGRFTFKDHVHRVKVHDKKGNHKSTIQRCKNCGTLLEKPADHRGRFECPTCGDDPERSLKLTKVVITSPMDQPVDLSQWTADGTTSRGHRRYTWQDPVGYKHIVITGSGQHDEGAARLDQTMGQQRMRACMLGKCSHARNALPEMATEANPNEGVFRPGDQVNLNGSRGIIVEMDGSLCVVQDLATGQEDVIPVQTLQRAATKEPDFLFVCYMGKLLVDPYHHNLKTDDMLQQLLKLHGYDSVPHDLDPTKVAAGEVFEYSDGSLKIEHLSLTDLLVREEADTLIGEWMKDKEELLPASAEEDDGHDDSDNDDHQHGDEDSSIGSGEYEHWRRLPRDDDGQWAAL